MACDVYVNVKYTTELDEKIRKIPGVFLTGRYIVKGSPIIEVPEDLFSQHKKEVDAHKWVDKEGLMVHHSRNTDKKWIYRSHGFNIWLNFEGSIVFMAPCHWDPEHGKLTIIDLKEWIKDNLGEDIEISDERVSF